MSRGSIREFLEDGSFIELSLFPIRRDRWRPHGVRYRMAWVQNGVCRVLFDNHHGKEDHVHIDGGERKYLFTSVAKLRKDFEREVRKMGGKI